MAAIPPLGFCGCGVCGIEPDVVVVVVVVVATEDGTAEGLELVAGLVALGT